MKNRKRKKRPVLGILLPLLILTLALTGYVLYVELFPMRYSETVEQYAAETGLDSDLIYAVIHTESKFREDAVSPMDAKGLMQINEITGEFISEKLEMADFLDGDLFIPETNIRMGTWYLSYLMELFGGETEGLAAYNAGPSRVRSWLANPEYGDGTNLTNIPFKETENYVMRVRQRQKIYRVLYFWN
ncbi:MAG TPA: lytic transglycosylase domain-containing protein [Clostridiaceae bacterium]|nr:lytic transglycosylase domain-containing protein [Clostridiaceae bacterium]